MDFDVRLEVREQLAILTIDNPPVNALHPSVSEAIATRLACLSDEADVRVLILTGAGKHFMAGADLEFVAQLDRRSAERYVLGIQKMQDELAQLPQPVIAVLHGATLGGGCELAMACDIRIAEQDLRIGQPEVSLGLIPGAGGTQALPRLVSLGRAKRMLFTGERIAAKQALEIGLVDEIVPTGTGLDRALDLARSIARNAPLAVTAAKRAVNLGMQMSLLDANRLEATLFASLVESHDLAEGIRAFFDKRPPLFENR